VSWKWLLLFYLLMNCAGCTVISNGSAYNEGGGTSGFNPDVFATLPDEMMPDNSSGRKPVGTRSDPFVGEGVIVRILRQAGSVPKVCVLHRTIPYFMRAMKMISPVASADVLNGISEGDMVVLSFELTKEKRYTIFAIRRLPDLPFVRDESINPMR
jgi:hypothetical protein